MGNIKLPRSSAAIGYNQELPVADQTQSGEYIGLALSGLAKALEGYAKFQEKETERKDIELISSLNVPGKVQGILDKFFNSEVTLEDGSVDYRASIERSDNIRSEWDSIVPVAADEIQQLINGLDVNDKLKSSLLSVTMGEMDKFITGRSDKIATERIERDGYFFKELNRMIEDGITQVSAGEGSDIIQAAISTGNAASSVLNNPELTARARKITTEARNLWISSYQRNTNGQLELALDLANGAMGPLTNQNEVILERVIRNLSGTSYQGGSTSGSSSTAIINSMDYTTQDQLDLLGELQVLAPDNLKPYIQFTIDKREADNDMSDVAEEAIKAQTSITETDFEKKLIGLSDAGLGKAGVDQIDKYLFNRGDYSDVRGEKVWRWLKTYNTLNNSIEVPPHFANILSNYLKTNVHGSAEEWTQFAKVAELYIQNNQEVPGISKPYKTRLKNFLIAFNLGAISGSDALINASSDEVVNPAEFATTAQVEIDGSGYFSDTDIYADQVAAIINGWGEAEWEKFLPGRAWHTTPSIDESRGFDSWVGWEPKRFKDISEDDKQSVINALSMQFGYLAKSLTLQDNTVTDQDAFGRVYQYAFDNLKASIVTDDSGDQVKIWLIRPHDLIIKNSKGEDVNLNPNVPNLIKDVLSEVEIPDTQLGTPLRWIEKLYKEGKLIPRSGGTYQIGIMENDLLRVARNKNGQPMYFNFNQSIVYKIHADDVADTDQIIKEVTGKTQPVSNGEILEAGKYAIEDILRGDNTGYYAGLSVSHKIKAIEDFLISGTGDPNPLSEESLSNITELKGFNDLPDDDRLVVLKQLVNNYVDRVSQPSFIGNPVTRPYFEDAIRNIAAERKAKRERFAEGIGGWKDKEHPLSGEYFLQSDSRRNRGMAIEKPHLFSIQDVPIALNIAKEEFLNKRVNMVGEGKERRPANSFEKGELLKEIKESTKKFSTSELYYGSSTIDSIVKRIVASVASGVKIPISTAGSDHYVIREVLSIIKERKDRPELTGTMSPVGDKKNPNRYYFELVGGTKQLPGFYSNEAIVARITEPLQFDEFEGPWFNLREIYKESNFKSIPKPKLIKKIYTYADGYTSTEVEMFDLIRATTMDLFQEDDQNLIFAMSDSRFAKFLWSLVGKEELVVPITEGVRE